MRRLLYDKKGSGRRTALPAAEAGSAPPSALHPHHDRRAQTRRTMPPAPRLRAPQTRVGGSVARTPAPPQPLALATHGCTKEKPPELRSSTSGCSNAAKGPNSLRTHDKTINEFVNTLRKFVKTAKLRKCLNYNHDADRILSTYGGA